MSDSFTILTSEEAAAFLQMNKTVLMRKAKRGEIPARKPGKRWIFVEEYLREWLKGDYSTMRQVSNSVDTSDKDKHTCQLRKEAKHGIRTSLPQTDNEYESLLKLK
ncbi:helix-turn-helix domain-containing protein [Thiomicrorhabdus sp.]|uniref:helix-turn-helix domain-containing protein n=1 Tax=Thiomicrorhabdus sp. TaxID=2039724 RepID=UPI0035639AD3